jgi:N-acetylmuramoyl-L-alanine amidase
MTQDRSAGTRGIRGHAVRTAAAAAALLMICGCAAGVVRPPAARRPRPLPGYERRADDLRSVDASALRDRRIALDPGHGGFFRGALGVDGLTEAEVNLGVALHLRGLLEARGAQVFLTRTDDSDFLAPSDSSLRADLAERVRLANDFHPDLLVSIHHNADARGAHDVNETQTYYRLGDEGPSLDAAQSVHRYLVRNLGIARNRVVPGNYFVLRNSESPALLTESSYLTNPDVEARLALAAKQRLEAEALFLGIAHFFARRAPVIEAFAIQTGDRRGVGSGSARDTLVETGDEPRFVAGVRGAFDRAELLLDGRPVPLVRAAGRLSSDVVLPAPGDHVAVLRASLAGAGSARERLLRFRMEEGPPTSVTANAFPERAASDAGIIGVRVRVATTGGFAAQFPCTVQLVSGSACLAPAETTVVTRDGAAWAYFHPVRNRPWKGDGRGVIEIVPRILFVSSWVEQSSAFLRADSAETGPRRRGVMLRAMPGDTALTNAPGTAGGGRTGDLDAPSHWLNRDGFAVFDLDSAGRAIVPQLPGYRPWAPDEAAPPPAIPLRWSAITGGALHGRRIVIDPDGGGDDAAGIGRTGTRAASLNLDVARALEAFLTAAGAEVWLTRGGDFALSDVERVQVSEAFRADRFLRIGHRAEPPGVGYYFSSAAGRRWADGTVRELERFALGAVPPAEDAQYPLQQTSCPALYVAPARVDDPVSEERLLSPGTLRSEAYALFLALAREWATEAEWPLDSIEVRDGKGNPVPAAAVRLGGATVLETDSRGRVRFVRTEPGPLEVEVDDPRAGGRRVLLDSQQGVVMTGSRGP